MTSMKRKILIVLGLMAVFSLFCGSGVSAVDSLVVQFETGSQPLFEEANFLPGRTVSRWAKVTNNSGQSQRIAAEAINYPTPIPAGDLSRALMFVIKQGTADLYGGSSPTGPKTLFDFYQDSKDYQEISLSDLVNGTTTQYDFIISFPSERENGWQGATTTFDILVGFQRGTDSLLPPSPPTPPSSGGGGVVPLGLTISNESDLDIQETSVTVTWLTSYHSTSQVVYAAEGESHILNLSDSTGTPPTYGYARTTPEYDTGVKVVSHSVTISGLAIGTKYYYRAISHGSLAISQERSFVTKEAGETNITAGEVGPSVSVWQGGQNILEGEGGVNSGSAEAGGETSGVSANSAMPAQSGAENGLLTEGAQQPEGLQGESQNNNPLGNVFAASIGLFSSDLVVLILLALIIVLCFIIAFLLKRRKRENRDSNRQFK